MRRSVVVPVLAVVIVIASAAIVAAAFLRPQVDSVMPVDGAAGVDPGRRIVIAFSGTVAPTSLNESTVALLDARGTRVPARISYDAARQAAVVEPTARLRPSTRYEVRVNGVAGHARVTGRLGLPLTDSFTASFRTAGRLAGPRTGSAPILVVTSHDNPFGSYYAEILRAEGLNLFAVVDASEINKEALENTRIVVLTCFPASAPLISVLEKWVEAGGNLIAMRPPPAMASFLGLKPAGASLADGYLLVDTDAPPGKGIVGETIQFHGVADRYRATDTMVLARLFSDPKTPTSAPAVTLRKVGKGWAAAFAYDLARSVVYTRQGNPEWAGQERDGYPPVRPDDMFYPDYANLDKVAIPQADEQQRLLANLIELMSRRGGPLPRFWYLPDGRKAVIIMAGDDHRSNDGTYSVFDLLADESAPGCRLKHWECLRATSYLVNGTPVDPAAALAYSLMGFELGVHVTSDCRDVDPLTLSALFTDNIRRFRATYPDLPAQHTNRTHCILWPDWDTEAKIERDHGIRLDLNYYYWPASWVKNRPGFFTGSGFPMRYADEDGRPIDVYQVPSLLVNEDGVSHPAGINAVLDRALGPQGFYGAFGTHYDYTDGFANELLRAAKAHGVALISVEQMLTWLDGRNGSAFENLAWDGRKMKFVISVASGADGLTAMVPAKAEVGGLTEIACNQRAVSYRLEKVKGLVYAFFPAQPGACEATYGRRDAGGRPSDQTSLQRWSRG
jgi:hypothetical protein